MVEMTYEEGQDLIPKEIRESNSETIANYLIDLLQSPSGEPLYRSKIMTVGYESVGKTTLLDCLFPHEGQMYLSEGKLLKEKKPYYFVLQGRFLRKYQDLAARVSEPENPLATYTLDHKQWKLEEINKGGHKGLQYGLALHTSHRFGRKEGKSFELFLETKEEREGWFSRLKRTCFNAATHGIEIQNPEISHPLIKEKLGEGARLEVSVWDFAGQLEYYQNHHYFISNRSVFLVLWKMSQGEEGLKGLEFWLRSLSFHLPPLDPSSTQVFFSVFVVGTFLDMVDADQREEREKAVKRLAKRCGLPPSAIAYLEVSCHTLENVGTLMDAIVKAMLSHSYMGEKIPMSYLSVQRNLREQRKQEERQALPLLSLEEIPQTQTIGAETVKRALTLMTFWGECVYFEQPAELASTVVLDPRFLTREVLGQLFNPEHVRFYKDGIVRHADLSQVWSSLRSRENFPQLAFKLVSLMKKFEVCFTLEEEEEEEEEEEGEEQEKIKETLEEAKAGGGSQGEGKRIRRKERKEKDFMRQKSVIPGLLGERREGREGDEREAAKRATLRAVWPKDPPFDRPLQQERILKFNVVPGELVSRLIVRLHPLIQEGLVWRNEVVLYERISNTQGWVEVDGGLGRFVVVLRGADRVNVRLFMERVLREVRASLAQHPGVSFQEQVRSPHDRAVSLSVQELREEALRGREERRLLCPSTLLPVKAERLLMLAGLLDRDPFPEGCFSFSFLPFFLFFSFLFFFRFCLVWFFIIFG